MTSAWPGFAQVAKDLGPVDILVNNAGITKDGMFHKMTPEQWYDVINTNLNSLFNMCRPVIEGMRERGFGRIINISSINGQKGQIGQSNYSASKAGDIQEWHPERLFTSSRLSLKNTDRDKVLHRVLIFFAK